MGCNSSSNQVQPFERKEDKKYIKPDSQELTDWLTLVETLQNKTDLRDYVLSRNRQSFRSLDELKEFLKKSPTETQVEKAWAAYLFICHNIDYNIKGFLSGNFGSVEPSDVFKTGLSVCSGYARLLKDLLDFFEIENVTINGYAKGYGYEIGKKFADTNHEWNAVYIDDKWQFIESTWVIENLLKI